MGAPSYFWGHQFEQCEFYPVISTFGTEPFYKKWLALTPPALVQAHGFDMATIAALPKTKPIVVGPVWAAYHDNNCSVFNFFIAMTTNSPWYNGFFLGGGAVNSLSLSRLKILQILWAINFLFSSSSRFSSLPCFIYLSVRFISKLHFKKKLPCPLRKASREALYHWSADWQWARLSMYSQLVSAWFFSHKLSHSGWWHGHDGKL